MVDIFRNYFKEHAIDFVDAPPMTNGEHNLEYYALFQKYLKLYEVLSKVHSLHLKYLIC